VAELEFAGLAARQRRHLRLSAVKRCAVTDVIERMADS
jgi:hypothetical protein